MIHASPQWHLRVVWCPDGTYQPGAVFSDDEVQCTLAVGGFVPGMICHDAHYDRYVAVACDGMALRRDGWSPQWLVPLNGRMRWRARDLEARRGYAKQTAPVGARS